MKKDLLEVYRNYLYALKTREEHGEKYGDTDELIEMYEEMLGIKKEKKEKQKCLKIKKKSRYVDENI